MFFDFMIVDVFTEAPFGGNQLAVITDARGLSSDAMQAITREFDFPETTFVLPPERAGHARRVRIFTPGGELPFAGHPTVGTACALLMRGDVPPGEMILEEGVGPVWVRASGEGDAYSARFRLELAPEMPPPSVSREEIAEVLSIGSDDVLDVFCSGLGVDYTFVQVGSPATVDRSVVDHGAWTRAMAGKWGAQLYVFSGDLRAGGAIHSRMFAPGLGITEDPATGSAAAALVGYAATLPSSRARESIHVEIDQGVAMGRPSRISAAAYLDGGGLKCIEVGGGCAFVARGQMRVPASFVE